MYNKYHKQKEVIVIPSRREAIMTNVVIPKSNDKNDIKSFNKFDMENKNNSYENIREIVLENKNNIKMEPQADINPSNNKFKNIF